MITDAKPRLTQTSRVSAREQRIQARERFMRTRLAERGFSRHLTRVAKHVGHLVEGMAPNGKVKDLGELEAALDRYSALLRPWAKALSSRLVEEVNQRDGKAWKELARGIGQELTKEVKTTPIMGAMNSLMEEQVELITSLPKKAAERVHTLTQKGLLGGLRADEVAAEIMKTGQVTEGRARLIARTETSRTASAMVAARAQHVGSTGYFWRTSGDSDVRPEHRKLNGKFFRWDNPPVSGPNGERSAPGAIFNCRCYPEPVLPDRI